MTSTEPSKASLWAGRAISALMVLFLLFDGITKVLKVPAVLAASAQLAYPVSAIPGIGIVLLVCTAFYVVPRTSVLGAILLTGYLGGAVASNVRIGSPLFNALFPIVFAALVWAGIFLRDARLRALVPLRN